MSPRICIVVSSPMTISAFWPEHIRQLERRARVTVVANARDAVFLREQGLSSEFVPLGICRGIDLLRDFRALARLIGILARGRFDMVHSVTPKAGILAALAGAIARVPIRIHTFTGQVWATRTGAGRVVLKAIDHLTATLATHLLVDSRSQRDFLIEQGVVRPTKASVLADGSISGVDLNRFRPDPLGRATLRASLGIPPEDVLFLFLGRLKREKGILDLARAFALVNRRHPAHLLMAGPDEENLRPQIRYICAGAPGHIHLVDYTGTPEAYVAAADVLCLPSYREGFGSVIIEAGAAGVPAIGTRIYGITDAVEDHVTGLLFPPGSIAELADAMETMIVRPGARNTMGAAARERTVRYFAAERLTAALMEFYEKVFVNGLQLHETG